MYHNPSSLPKGGLMLYHIEDYVYKPKINHPSGGWG